MSTARASFALSALALFVALGGGAVALQGKNSVNSGDIKDNNVKGQDVKADTLRSSDIHADAVQAADVKAGAIGSAELTNGSVTALDVDTLPHAVLTATSSQSIGNNFHDTVDLDTVVSLEDATFNNTTDRLTVNTPGLYLVSGWIAWENNGAGSRQLDFRKNFNAGAFFFGGQTALPGDPTADQVSTSWLDRFEAGDTIELAAIQNSGANLGTATVHGRTASLAVAWLGP